LYQVVTSLDLVTIFLQSKVISLASNPQPGGPGPVFMSSSNRVAQLYPQAPGLLLVTFYNLQGYGGGILPCFHMGTRMIMDNKLKKLL
jgi:hypothetical protein